MTHPLRFAFMQLVRSGFTDVDKRDVERVVRDDKWLVKCLQKSRGDAMDALWILIVFCRFRMVNGVRDVLQGKRFEDYKALVRFHGKDKRGTPLLTFNVTELERYGGRNNLPNAIPDLFLRIFEEIDSGSGSYENISVLFYHGENKCMEHVPKYILTIHKIQQMYFDIVDTFYVFQDVLSYNCRRNLEFLQFHSDVKITIMSRDNLKDQLVFDIHVYEKENLELNKINGKDEKKLAKEKQNKEKKSSKQTTPIKGMSDIKDNHSVSQKGKKKKNRDKGNSDEKNDEASGGVSEGGEAEVKVDKPTKVGKERNTELKDLLKKLHNIQMDINNIVQDVMQIM